MDAPYQGSPDVHVFPANLPLPGVGVLPVNAYLLMAEEPVLIDSGIGIDGDDFMAALSSIMDPRELKWVWLTHDDADHTGSIQRIMELAPNAKLVTHGFSAFRMATWWPVPMERVLDQSTGSLFSVDAFGAILPEPTQDASDVSPEALAGGMLGWATSDSPWAHIVDRERFSQVLDRVRQLQPTRIFSSHLPAASGTSLEAFLEVLETVPDAEPFMPPDSHQFAQMIAAMAEMQRGSTP